MEEQILAVDLSTEQTLEVNLPEQDNVAQIDVYWQDEVVLDLDASLMYIVSGQQEIQDYVDNKSKPEIDEYIQDYAKPIVSEVVDQIATPIIDEYFENTVKPSITEFAEEEMAGYAATATAQAEIATEKANEASETAKIVDEKVQEFSQTTEASKNEFVNFAQEKTEEFEQTAITATEQAVGSAERSRIWAEGEQAEVQELGGELSSKGWANIAKDRADVASASADRAEKIAQGFDGVVNTIEGSIGDIGFAPFGIDESQNKRRYLNGQVISQSQFESFTKKIKEAIALYPSLFATEENWQAEVTNSPYGICGKFVIDDEAGTIRLPKYPDWSIREVGEVAVYGNGMTLGFTNGSLNVGIAGSTSGGSVYNSQKTYGTTIGTNASNSATSLSNLSMGVTTDPTKSGIIADLVNANTEDKLQGKWFIQVATGVEESVDVTREIELNNPFSLLDYKWSEYKLNNASWLISNGSFHSGTVYKAVYELLLKLHNGTETKDGVSVKLSTEAYTDTDFVINTADTTFRLPIKVKLASGNAVVGNGMTLGLMQGNTTFGTTIESGSRIATSTSAYGTDSGSNISYNNIESNKTFGVTTDPTKSGIETSSSGLKLYFYVGETIQDANVINAAGVFTALSNKVGFDDKETIISWGMPDYSAGIALSTAINTPQLIQCDGLLLAYENDNYVQIDLCDSGGTTVVANLIANAGYAYAIGGGSAFVSKGSYIKNITAPTAIVLYPLKGVK